MRFYLRSVPSNHCPLHLNYFTPTHSNMPLSHYLFTLKFVPRFSLLLCPYFLFLILQYFLLTNLKVMCISFILFSSVNWSNASLVTVDGGHRAIIFSRLGGVQKEVYAEGLHFRIPWFHYPIIYDIR